MGRDPLRTFALYVAVFHSVAAFCCRHSRIRRIRESALGLKERKSQDDLSTILTSVGLKPVIQKTPVAANGGGAGPKARQQKQQHVANKRKPQLRRQPTSPVTRIPFQIQLDYARNGSGALRALLEPQVLQTVRSDLLEYSAARELEAWRQKVEVGSMNPERANACRTIQDCKKELEKLQIGLDNLPFLQYFNTWRDLETVKDLCFSLGQAASILLDVPSVRLYQDALFTKRAGDGATPWHVDARMAPFDTSHMITFWIPLQEVPVNGTALLFVPKSHSDFALPFWNDFDGKEYGRLEERYNNQESTHYMPLALGDVTVHSGWTLHCADGNDSNEDRHALAVTFVDSQAEIRETALKFTPSDGGGYGDNEDQWSYREWVQEVPKRKKIGNHSLVPIVWPRKKKS